MADSMMRIAGRASDGTAQPMSLIAVNGDHVLRVVDAAPFAYDKPTDSLRIRPKRALPAITPMSISPAGGVAAGAGYTFTLTPPVGEIWRIRSLGVDIPAPVGAASGSHFFNGFYGSAATALNQIFSISNAFGGNIKIFANSPITKNYNIPTEALAFVNTLSSLVCSNACPLVLLYTNATNVAQTGILGLTVVKEIEYVA